MSGLAGCHPDLQGSVDGSLHNLKGIHGCEAVRDYYQRYASIEYLDTGRRVRRPPRTHLRLQAVDHVSSGSVLQAHC